MIPVQRPYLGPEELKAVQQVFDTRWLGMGSTTKEFEERLREFLGAKHVIAVNTGTSALHLALAAVGLVPGDEVIVPSLTFAASLQAIMAVGARPVFCDIAAETLNIDLNDAFGRVTPRTRAIMPVHYGGLACEMDELMALAKDHGIWVVEDAAHAFGSTYKGRQIGTVGDVTCFSFDPIKNITCGEGGAVVTNNDEIAARITPKRILGIDNDTWSRYRNERNWFYEVVTIGYRYHLSNVNAAIGLEQLKRFDVFKKRKTQIVELYDRAFAGLPGLALIKHDLDEMFPFFYIVRVLNGRRDAMMQFLKEAGIGTGVHYIPNHIQPLFADSRASLPVTEQVFEEILTLPLYYEMTDADVDCVIGKIQTFVQKENR
ncbi:MAG TPA: DegT/DnrJ/EryC1/StrS family aminotransferase [Pyrinomonadaceae bacterium]|jgi:perosamine synthetase|nr:DegT/DnrJ/EryC1/StrS family aminotransferase [Pyrinomonadaceae bacterium]